MKIDAKTYKITIDGESYTLSSDEGEGHLRVVEKIVDGIVKDLRAKNPHMASSRLALCAAIQCASLMTRAEELVRCYRETEDFLVFHINQALSKSL